MLINSMAKIVFLSMLATQWVWAENTVQRQDFDYFAPLSEGKQSLRQFELPYSVLAKLKRQDYGDMRIFNAQNQPVPFSISQFEAQTLQNTESYDLRFFRSADNSAQQNSDLQMEFSQNGTRLSFNSATTEHPKLNYLIVENQHPDDDLQAIKLNWQQSDTAFSVKVKLETSDDLQSWQTVNEGFTLYDLNYLDHALVRNTLPLPYANHAKYLRLSFQSGNNFSLQINKITAEYRHTTTVEKENWESFALEAGEKPNQWLFNTGSFAPMTKIELLIPSVGLFYQGSLYSKNGQDIENSTKINPQHPSFKREVKRALHHRPEYQPPEQSDWIYQGTLTQYRLLIAAGEIKSEPIMLSTSKDKQWKLVLEQPASLLAEQIPTVKMAWHPVRVTFLAQGKPPFQLLFGGAKVEPFNAVLPPSSNDNNVETVNILAIQAVAKTAVAPESKQLTAVIKQLNWHKILLWFLLCAGVVVMGAMAYQLYAKMNQKKD